jgi:transposase
VYKSWNAREDVMLIQLSESERASLSQQHKKERDRRVADRIKAIVLADKGWTETTIAEALLLSEYTIRDHIRDYQERKKLKPENGGSESKLTDVQSVELISHLEEHTYLAAREVCAHVKAWYGVEYTVAGINEWLHCHKFSYKKPKATPAKADPAKQEEFIAAYEKLRDERSKDEPILFLDAVHPTMATKISEGWIRTGHNKPIASTASRTRVNLVGALNLETMAVTSAAYETVNSASLVSFLGTLRDVYKSAPTVHVILDRGSYNISNETKESASKHGITLHHLPPYSPNLNPIERLWKVLGERVRNNVVFASAKEFREAITNFFETKWPVIAQAMKQRINDNFQRINWASSA